LFFDRSEMMLVLNGVKDGGVRRRARWNALALVQARADPRCEAKAAWKVVGGVPNQLLGSYSYNTVTPTNQYASNGSLQQCAYHRNVMIC
jgi:hypothetical protein